MSSVREAEERLELKVKQPGFGERLELPWLDVSRLVLEDLDMVNLQSKYFLEFFSQGGP